MRRLLVAVCSTALFAVSGVAAPARATFEGKNGPIAFSFLAGPTNAGTDNFEISTIVPGEGPVAMPAQNSRKDNWPDWSPDGTRIVWWHQGPAGNLDVWVMNADGSGQTNLTSENPRADANAAWSPDATSIVLESGYQTSTGFSELQVIDATGTVWRQLTSNGPDFDSFPQFSPDGGKIVWSHDPDGGHPALFTMDADDGQNVFQVTPDWLKASLPDWSPDGEWILFVDNFCGPCPASDIWMIRKDGTDLTRITDTPLENEFKPGWSPDGKKITFSSIPSPFTGPADIYVMNLRSSGRENITNTPDFNERASDWGPRVQGGED